ncbi:MAG: NUDIX hydrolase [Anaerolineae bacterium]|jgi:8-oxo-dGTP pyrophosphatase MutT (NUDIX family)|nr:NUDIX hydrolase [Anaerolineae bacterium]
MAEHTFTSWKTLDRRTILDCGKFLKVEMHTVALPDGRVIDDWTWVVSPDFINVVAETVDGDYLCFRQTKYAVQGTSLAVVGGYIEPGEPPLTAAKRELLEETGYEAPEWIGLGAYPVEANRGVQTGHFFLARGARQVADPTADDLEEQEILRLTRAEMARGLAAGEFKVLAWTAIVALALLWQPVPGSHIDGS